MHALAPLIKDLAIILGVASIVTLLFQKMKQPVVLGYIVAGIIVGPYTPPYNLVSDIPNIKILSELGVIFLMFSLGLEFSFHKLTRVGFSAAITGFIEVILMLILGFFVGKALGWSFYDCIFLGAALSISSTTIIIKALSELNLKTKSFAELIFGILIVEDLLAILLLVGLSTLAATQQSFSLDLLWAGVKLFIVVGGWFLVGYFMVPMAIRKVMHFANEETITITSVALCLFLVCIAAFFDYSTALGAFIMGSILAETPLVERIETLVTPIRDMFAAVFFVSVGMLIDPRIIIQHWSTVILLSIVTILGKILITSMGALLSGQRLNTATRIGFGMAQIGEFSFIIAGLGLALNATSPILYPIIVAVSAITTFTTPYLIRVSGYVSYRLEKALPTKMNLLIDNYSTMLNRSLNTKSNEAIYRKYFSRLILNGIMVAIAFTLTQKLISPEINLLIQNENTANLINWFIALLLSSPFLWGMLFSSREVKLVAIIGWAITVAELMILSFTYFFTPIMILFIIIIASLFFGVFHKRLGKFYHWIELRLVSNIKRKEEE